jgi:hypothetical protein
MAKMGKGVDPSKLVKNQQITGKTRAFFGCLLFFIGLMMYLMFFSYQKFEQPEVISISVFPLTNEAEIASIIKDDPEKGVDKIFNVFLSSPELYRKEGETAFWLFNNQKEIFMKNYDKLSPRAMIYFLSRAEIVYYRNFFFEFNENALNMVDKAFLLSGLKKIEKDP